MSKLIVLNLGTGNWQTGFATVIAQLWEPDRPTPMQFVGKLPALPVLENLYRQWQGLYGELYANLSGQRLRSPEFEFEIDTTDITHISAAEFGDRGRELQQCLNTWLRSEGFQPIDRQLRTHLTPTDEIRLIIVAEEASIRRLPWCLWEFLDDYPQAEIALSLPDYLRSPKAAVPTKCRKVKILAIIGNSAGIDVEHDRQLLYQLPQAEVKLLVEPSAKDINEQLWKPGWDILFFAGHSSSQDRGYLQLNQRDRLTIDQLKYSLRQAIAHGLKLAIFNSCDGLGLAQALADLQLPQMIVMREPVPDRVAQEFLKYFLTAFAAGQPLYRAVREAREKLQAWETDFPCASWLPVICQNPAEVPPLWQDWAGPPAKPWPLPTWREVRTILLSSLVVTGLVSGGRWLGWLQAWELDAFDRLMQLRPAELPDNRLLVVTVTEADIQAQGTDARRSSLSDRSLAQLLAKLAPHQPIAIGLDIFRDFPAEPALANRLKQSKNFIAICKRSESGSNPTSILSPPEIPTQQVGFNDLLQDSDGVIRRQLLFMSPNTTSPCKAAYSFSLQLAFRYLEQQGIVPQFDSNQNLQLGPITFRRLGNRSSGYQAIDARGSQVLLNYRATPTPQAVAQQVSLGQLLRGEINPQVIQNRLVLVGIAAPNSNDDYWSTPYGRAQATQLPGVLIHAQMVSQILSAVLDGRSLLWVWAGWQEVLWLGLWALVGGGVAWGCRSLPQWGAAIVGLFVLIPGVCWLCLLQGGWIPLVPPLLTLVITSGAVAYRRSGQSVPQLPVPFQALHKG